MAPTPSPVRRASALLSAGGALVALLAGGSIAAADELVNIDSRPPTIAMVRELERAVTLPEKSCKLAKYTRHYATVVDQGRALLAGAYVHGPSRIVIEKDEDAFTRIAVVPGRECQPVAVLYDPKTHEFLRVTIVDAS